MPKFNEYTEKTNPDDVDIFLLQDAASTRKISFLNIFNRIKTKLGLGELATKSKVAQSDLEAALANLIAGKLTSSGIANNLTTTDTTKVLAAPQGKALLESITSALTLIGSLDALTTTEKTNLVGSINELVTSLTALNSNLQSTNDLIWDTGYVPQPYYFGVPVGEAALVITSDGAMWYVASLSSSFNIVKMNDITTTHTVTGNASDRVITVRSSTAGNIRLTRIHLKPRYK